MTSLEVPEDGAELDAALAALPGQPAVFLLWPRAGKPYLARTALLRRRLARLLGARDKPSRFLNLRGAVTRIEYRLTGSGFESTVRMYELARRHFPDSYAEMLNLRMPPYIRIGMENQFPRSSVTNRLGRPPSLHFGPFRSRASAEAFEQRMLDLFQMRRCHEDLAPSPDHPGCIYGEMGMCLRPCQAVVGADEYRHEAARVAEFLSTNGRSLSESIARSRDRFSEELQFEEAARQHKRLEKVQEVLKPGDELARDVDQLHGVAITSSVAPDAVEMWFVRGGWWLAPRRFSFEVREGRPVSLDGALREAFASLEPVKITRRERQEYLALLARWFYSSWRTGEWVAIDRFENVPYRKLVHAVSRVAHGTTPA